MAVNASTRVMNGTYELADWTPTIAIVVAASVILGLVFTYFAGRRD